MDKCYVDQAEGLRRMLSGSRPRVFTFLSAGRREDQSGVLLNLGATLARDGNSALLFDARPGANGLAAAIDATTTVTLAHVARLENDVEEAVYAMPQGFDMAALSRASLRQLASHPAHSFRLRAAFDLLAEQYDVIMVDAELDTDGDLPLPALSQGTIVVLVSDDPASIKSAYAIIKRLNATFGRQSISVLVTGTSSKRAQVVYANMARVCSRYLALPLSSMGFVPADEHVRQAARLGRSVVDAFPLAGASVAFRQLAGYFSCSGVPNGGLDMA